MKSEPMTVHVEGKAAIVWELKGSINFVTSLARSQCHEWKQT